MTQQSHYWAYTLKVKVKSLCRIQLFATPWTLCSPGPSIYGIFQARVLEWVAISFSGGSSWPRDWTHISCIEGRFFTIWSTREWASIPILRNSSCTLKAQQIDRLEFYLRWKHHAGRIARDTAPELEGWVPTMLLLAVRLTWGRKE